MELRSGNRKLDPYRPTFDPGLDVATVVFSHVRCVKTRFNLSLVSKLWRDASKPAAAYPDRFDFDAFTESWRRHGDEHILDKWRTLITRMLDNDEALSLPYERVVGLLGGTANFAETELCNYAALQGSVRLLKWERVNDRTWGANTCAYAAYNGHLPALQYLHENGCPWSFSTCYCAALFKHWDCLQYAVDNKCDEWEKYAKEHAEHLR
jgi:hypothetical protein